MMIPFGHALAFAAALFVLGLTCVLLRRQVIMILVGVEIMLNAASLVFVAASAYWQQADGQIFVILLMAITAAEVAVALAMVVYLWRRKCSLVADVFNGMRGRTRACSSSYLFCRSLVRSSTCSSVCVCHASLPRSWQ